MGAKIRGPKTAELPNITEYNIIPPGRSFLGINFAIIADLAGISIARKIPVKIDNVITCQGSIKFCCIRIPVINVTKAKSNLVERTICNLLCLSEIIPPKSENSNIGARLAVITNPSIISDSVNVLISHNLPYTNDHIPIFENNAAIQNNLYSWYLKQ